MKVNTNLEKSKESIKTVVLFKDIPIGTTFIHVFSQTVKIKETKISENRTYCKKCVTEHTYRPNAELSIECCIYE